MECGQSREPNWRGHIEARRSSGRVQKGGSCAEHGLGRLTLRYWIGRLTRVAAVQPAQLGRQAMGSADEVDLHSSEEGNLGDAIQHPPGATHSRSEFLRPHLSSESRPYEQIAALRKRHTTDQQCMTPRVSPRTSPSLTRAFLPSMQAAAGVLSRHACHSRSQRRGGASGRDPQRIIRETVATSHSRLDVSE